MRVQDFEHAKQAGDFFFTDVAPERFHLHFLCPCGCGILAGIILRADGKDLKPAWAWNLNFEKPTARPSILINDGHWHGYLTNGVFESC